MVLTMEMEGTDKDTGNKGGMVVTSDMWLAPKVSGYNEIAEFHKRMSQKLNWAPTGLGAMGARPDMMKGMAELAKESAKLNGMPVFQTVTMGMHAEGQADAQAPPPQQQQEQQADRPSIGGVLGGLGGFGRKKKSQDQGSTDGQQAQGSTTASGTLMEMTMEMSGFSAAPVDGSKFEVPAGFKQVEPDAMQHRRR
jgi:hypothetical protein